MNIIKSAKISRFLLNSVRDFNEFHTPRFLLCACSSDEQIDGGWGGWGGGGVGGGGGGGGEAVAEHLTSGMLHLHDQLRTCV